MQTTFYQRNYTMGVLGDWVPNSQVANPNSAYWRDVADDLEARLIAALGADGLRSWGKRNLPESGTQMEFATTYQQALRNVDTIKAQIDADAAEAEMLARREMSDDKAEQLADIVLDISDRLAAQHIPVGMLEAEAIPFDELQECELARLGIGY